MSRNLNNEMQWRKKNYSRFEASVPKEIAEEFREYLKNNNISFNEWCKNKISKELAKK